jgi:prefoldin alpha subunit
VNSLKPAEILGEYEFCRNQSEVYQQNLKLIDDSLLELKTVNKALDEIKGTEKNSESLIPIGADSFIKAKMTDPENVIVGIGSDVAVKKTVEDAKKDIENRIAGLEKVKKDQISNLEKLISRLGELEPSVRDIVAQTTKKEG